MQSDFLIIGGGVVGMAVAYGLVRAGQRVTVLDESDDAFRASRGNAGLTWVQGKGIGMPHYAELSLDASLSWPAFAAELEARTEIDIEHECRGGVDLCFDAPEAKARQRDYAELQSSSRHLAQHFRWEYLDRQALQTCLPGLGKSIHGGTWSPHDGHCNPLHLLRALHAACRSLGMEYHAGTPVLSLSPCLNGFRAATPDTEFHAERVIVAAGLGARTLAPMLGLTGTVRPVRGQMLVTERMPRVEQLPTPQLRQTATGGYLIGDTHEEVGFDKGVSLEVMSFLADRAVRIYPFLRQARLIRAWGALRIMTPDGAPLYEASSRYPGAYNLNCHSGISLAAFHANELARAIIDDRLEERWSAFSGARFDVPAHR
ncbi:NAD(P)/FAD-dependent oxidoreductase [Aidingimonas lacisalsi]|uniref:NAD(P)/FAD-dependent oxidoreductase n=1 Tax=Aidingimonas lacisalsi TaxID=2604086 RepID=UPI0011D21276|nr:FAD-dependent oxidoreductase [Aidingimonas lacisalsi]